MQNLRPTPDPKSESTESSVESYVFNSLKCEKHSCSNHKSVADCNLTHVQRLDPTRLD